MSTQYLTVSALTRYIKRKFEADPYLERVYLTGEISNYRKRPNHQYFNLKDEQAVISAVMYRREFSRLRFDLKEGMKVLVIGRVDVYEPSGNYNIIIEHMEPDGIGALYQAYEELKERLWKEGLFSLPKKPLPAFPKKIAVVTSPSGAVIRDIMTTLKRRYPIAQLVLFPTVVQGKDAAQSIVRNLKAVDAAGEYDVVIAGRGGGSIEDLWPFNEEAVVRQIAAMETPVISSVGHETDTTLADLAADVRAATPTAAAELAAPVLQDVLVDIQKQEQRLYKAVRNNMAIRREQLNRLQHSYILRQPRRIYEGYLQKVDQARTSLEANLLSQLQRERYQYERFQTRLLHAGPQRQLEAQKQQWKNLDGDLVQSMNRYMADQKQELIHLMEELDLLSPLKIMARGFSYSTFGEQILTSVKQVKKGDQIEIHMQDGRLQAEVTTIKEETIEETEHG